MLLQFLVLFLFFCLFLVCLLFMLFCVWVLGVFKKNWFFEGGGGQDNGLFV